jgi:hypothetical protein
VTGWLQAKPEDPSRILDLQGGKQIGPRLLLALALALALALIQSCINTPPIYFNHEKLVPTNAACNLLCDHVRDGKALLHETVYLLVGLIESISRERLGRNRCHTEHTWKFRSKSRSKSGEETTA